MSSFQKAGAASAPRLSGTKLKNGLPCVSSGVPSLDHVVGGSIPVGTVFMIEEDVLRNYSRVMSKFFLAEAVVCKHAVLLASLDDDPKEIIKELPSPTPGDAESNSQQTQEENNKNDKMKIAWRYEGQATVESSFGTNTHFGHHFDLSRYIDMETINNSDISYWSHLTHHKNGGDFKNQFYHDLLSTIYELTKKDDYSISSGKCRNVLRICICSIGSPRWMAHENEDGYSWNERGRDVMKFMYCLRVMLRGTSAVALVTVPTHLFGDDHHITKHLLNSADNAVKLESFAGSDRETNPVFKDYHGLFHITKLSAINALVPYLPPSLDLAFKLRRKKFIIEKLHLPPELQESSEREQDDVTATAPACGTFNKKHIDF